MTIEKDIWKASFRNSAPAIGVYLLCPGLGAVEFRILNILPGNKDVGIDGYFYYTQHLGVGDIVDINDFIAGCTGQVEVIEARHRQSAETTGVKYMHRFMLPPGSDFSFRGKVQFKNYSHRVQVEHYQVKVFEMKKEGDRLMVAVEGID